VHHRVNSDPGIREITLLSSEQLGTEPDE